MTTLDYGKIYGELTKQLADLKERRTAMEVNLGDVVKEIEALERSISHLAPLAGYLLDPESVVGLGITDAVHSVLDIVERLSVAQIRERMVGRGFDFSSYSAPNASIHTILKRLVEAKKAEVEKEGWKTYYKRLLTDEEIPF